MDDEEIRAIVYTPDGLARCVYCGQVPSAVEWGDIPPGGFAQDIIPLHPQCAQLLRDVGLRLGWWAGQPIPPEREAAP